MAGSCGRERAVIRAVVFDFDGVLVESVSVKTEAFRSLFSPEGPEVAARIVAYHLAHGGVSRMEKFRYAYEHILRRPLFASELQALSDRFKQLVFDGVLRAPWVPGALDALEAVQCRGWLAFVVSGTPEDELRDLVARRGVARFFAGVYGSPATKSELLRRMLDGHGLQRGHTLMVGDALTDYEAAKATGISFVARRTTDAAGLWEALDVPVVDDLTALARAWDEYSIEQEARIS